MRTFCGHDSLPGLRLQADEHVLHVYTECPEGRIIAIAKRDTVSMNSPDAMKDLEVRLVPVAGRNRQPTLTRLEMTFTLQDGPSHSDRSAPRSANHTDSSASAL